MKDEAGRRRVVIDKVRPEIDGGRFPVKRVVGEAVEVEAFVARLDQGVRRPPSTSS